MKLKFKKKKKNQSRRYEVRRLLESRVSYYLKLLAGVSLMLVLFEKLPLCHSQIACFDLNETNLLISNLD